MYSFLDRKGHTSLAGSAMIMMLISNLAEAHHSPIAAARLFQKLIWIVMLAGSQFLKCINCSSYNIIIVKVVVFHYYIAAGYVISYYYYSIYIVLDKNSL